MTACCSIPARLRKIFRTASSIAIRKHSANMTHSKGRHLPGRHLPAGGKSAPDVSRLGESLAGSWPLNGDVAGSLHGDAKFVDSPFGKAVSFTTRRRFRADPSYRCAERRRRRLYGSGLDPPQPTPQSGDCRAETRVSRAGILTWPTTVGPFGLKPPDPTTSPTVYCRPRPGAIRVNTWQHVAVV